MFPTNTHPITDLVIEVYQITMLKSPITYKMLYDAFCFFANRQEYLEIASVTSNGTISHMREFNTTNHNHILTNNYELSFVSKYVIGLLWSLYQVQNILLCQSFFTSNYGIIVFVEIGKVQQPINMLVIILYHGELSHENLKLCFLVNLPNHCEGEAALSLSSSSPISLSQCKKLEY